MSEKELEEQMQRALEEERREAAEQYERVMVLAAQVESAHLLHLERIKKLASRRIDLKYLEGVIEHGGGLWEWKPEQLLDAALDEAIDQVVYLLTLRAQLPGGGRE